MATESDTELGLKGLVHDLNNVLGTIAEAAELLSADPQWSTLAGAIQRSVERGRRLVEGFSEKAGGAVDLEVVLDSAIASARDFVEVIRGPQVEFRRHLQPGLQLAGIPAAWERVFINLFLNAVQAMPVGGVVEIRASRQGGLVEISVADEGPGIAPDLLPSIFEPYISTKSVRSGLGLHIVRSIVTKNGGTVTAVNRPGGRGAEFTIALTV